MLDETSIFAQVDAFIQRCRDLLEVVEGQMDFARYSEGKKKPIPCFGGCRGPEVTRSWKEIEHTFGKHLAELKAVRKTILDVKATSWHDDYNRFRAGVKELEVMMQNVINSVFMTVTTVQEGVELLEVFAHLAAKREVSYPSFIPLAFLLELSCTIILLCLSPDCEASDGPPYCGPLLHVQ